jgi:outer membrane protein assembly factor BamB/tetratricopeptide (TPR) repeat protein
MSFKGDLSTIGLAEVFQMISMSQKEGTLLVQDNESRKAIYFGPTGVKLTSTGRRKGLRLGDMLVRTGKLAEATLAEALENAKIQKRMLGEVLVESGYVSEADIQQVVRSQIEEEIYDLFLWKKASFEFIEGPPSDSLTDPDMRATSLSFDVNGLLLEAVRRADEWAVINQKIASMDSIYVFSSPADRAEEEAAATESLRRAYPLLDGRASVTEIVENTGVPKFEVCKGLVELLDRGKIRSLNTQELLEVAQRRMAEGPRDKGLRLYLAAAAQAPDDPVVIVGVAKVLEAEGLTKEAAAYLVKAARVFLERGSADRALDHLQQAAGLNPEDPDIKYGMFEAHAAAGNLDEGKTLARELVAQALMTTTDYLRARGLCDRIVNADPADLDFRVLRAKILHRTNQKKDLEEELSFIRKNMPIDPKKVETIERELKEVLVRTPTSVQPAAAAPRRPVAGRRRPVGLVAGVALAVAAGVAAGVFEFRARRELDQRLAEARGLLERREFAPARKAVEDFASATLSPLQKARAADFLKELEAERLQWESDRKAREEEQRRIALEKMREAEVWISEERFRRPEEALQKARDMREFAEANKDRDYVMRFEELAKSLDKYLSDALQLKVRADELEQQGMLREAAKTIDDLLARFSYTPAARGALFPLEIVTVPTGVRVTSVRNNMVLGVTSAETPLRHRMKSGDPVRLLFEKPGYVSVERPVPDKAVGRLRVELTEKREAWTLPVGLTLSAGISLVGESLYVGASDRLFALRIRPRPAVDWSLGIEGGLVGAPSPGKAGWIYLATSANFVYAIDPSQPSDKRVVWRVPAGERISGPPSVSRDGSVVYFGTADRALHALEAATGRRLWKRDVGGEIRGEPIATDDGAVVVACDTGPLVAFKGPEPEPELWRAAASGFVTASLSGDVIYAAGSDQSLLAVDAKTGRKLWARQVPSLLQGRVAAADGLVFAAGRDGRVYFLNASSGAMAGNYAADGNVPGGVAIHGSLVLFGSEDKTFYAFDAAARSLAWKFPGGKRIRGAPVVRDGFVYFSAEDTVYAIELN